MIRSRQSGMSYWPFVVSLFLLVIAAYLWYEAAGELETEKGKRATADKASKAAESDRIAMQTKLLTLSEAVGWMGTDRASSPVDIKAALEQAHKDLLDELTITLDLMKYSETGEGGKIEEIGQGKQKIVYLPTEEQGRPATLQELLPLFKSAAKRMQADIINLVAVENAHGEKVTQLEAGHQAAIEQKDQRITQLEGQVGGLQANLDEQQRELQGAIDSLNRQKDQLNDQLTAQQETAEKREAELQNKLSQSAGEITRLNDREVPYVSEGPDGEVLASNDNITVVNRGKDDMLMPGTIFTVLGRKSGGRLVAKGTIKVTVVGDETSKASVLAMNSGAEPIVEGDLIQSAVYSPNRKLHFHLVGEFDRLGRNDLATRLTSLGAVVDSKVLPTTHYLVVGRPSAGSGVESIESTAAYQLAQRYGIKMLTETQLSSFVKF